MHVFQEALQKEQVNRRSERNGRTRIEQELRKLQLNLSTRQDDADMQMNGLALLPGTEGRTLGLQVWNLGVWGVERMGLTEKVMFIRHAPPTLDPATISHFFWASLPH